MLEVTLQAKDFSELKNYSDEERKKNCHHYLSMKAQLEPVLQEDMNCCEARGLDQGYVVPFFKCSFFFFLLQTITQIRLEGPLV